MTPLRKRTLDYMIIKGYAEATKTSYIYNLQQFALYFNSCPSKLEESHVIAYLRHLAIDKGMSKGALNAAYSAIKILFVNILDKPWNTLHIPRPPRGKTLPSVLSKEQVQTLFEVTKNVKHKTILMLIYCTGLRVSEASKLKVKDIIPCRKVIHIRQGKGAKDRYSILSDRMLAQLTTYRGLYRPTDWLFTGQNPTQAYSKSSISCIYQQAKKKAKIPQTGGVHQLRHCFATHMLEAGMSLPSLQKLLGHSSLRATSIYLHLSKDDFSDFQHPLDD